MDCIQKIIRKHQKKLKKVKSSRGEIRKDELLQYLSNDPIILEAGAHIGRDTIQLAMLWPEGHIFAFEPVSEIYQQLVANTNHYDNIKCVNLALSNKIGNDSLFLSCGSSDASSSLLKPLEHLMFHPDVTFLASELVRTITIDQWAFENGVTKIDFLWLDLQGMEYEVLKASPNIMKDVKVIYTEVNLVALYDGTLLYPEYKRWLLDQGFKVEKKFIPWRDAGNVLFIRSN